MCRVISAFPYKIRVGAVVAVAEDYRGIISSVTATSIVVFSFFSVGSVDIAVSTAVSAGAVTSSTDVTGVDAVVCECVPHPDRHINAATSSTSDT